MNPETIILRPPPSSYIRVLSEAKGTYQHIHNSIKDRRKAINSPKVSGINTDLVDELILGTETAGYTIAGGFARFYLTPRGDDALWPEELPLSERPFGDIDLFPLEENSIKRIKRYLEAVLNYEEVTETEFSKTFQKPMKGAKGYSIPVQLIKKSGTPIEILESFDLINVRAAIVGEGKYVFHDRFFSAERANKLVIGKAVINPASTLSRLLKYSTRKYTVDITEMMKILLSWDNVSDEYKEKVLDMLYRRWDESGISWNVYPHEQKAFAKRVLQSYENITGKQAIELGHDLLYGLSGMVFDKEFFNGDE